MMPAYVPQVVGLAYMGTDLALVVGFLRLRGRISSFNFNLIIVTRFRELVEFYRAGETTNFVEYLSGAPENSLDMSSFSDNYGALNREIEELHSKFKLPYSLMGRPSELLSSSYLLVAIVAILIVLDVPAAGSSLVMYLLLFALLVNSVMYYPLLQLWSDVKIEYHQAMEEETRIRETLVKSEAAATQT